jgi:hypothetical protein
LAETVSAGLLPKFPFADVAEVYASDTSTVWANDPAASADRTTSIDEILVNELFIATPLFIETSLLDPMD